MTALLLLSVGAAVAIATTYFVVPKLAQLAAVHTLHAFRGRLYRLGDESEAFRATTFYRDIEFGVTMAIHVVRDRSVADAMQFFAALRPRQSASIDRGRVERYNREIEESLDAADRLRFVQRATSVLEGVEASIGWRILWCHPLLQPFALLLMIGLACKIFWDRVRSPTLVTEQTARLVPIANALVRHVDFRRVAHS